MGWADVTRAILPGLAAVSLVAAGVVTVVHAEKAEQPKAAETDQADLGDPYTMAGQTARQRTRMGRQHTPSPQIITDQTIPLRFSHRLHVGDLDCTECHEKIPDSIRSSDDNLPEEETCFNCHDANDGMTDPPGDPPGTCGTCHPGYVAEFPEGTEDFDETSKAKIHPPSVHLPPPHLKFNHKVHIAKGVECSTCHGDLSAIDFATRESVLPVMGTCLTCHDGKTAPDECKTCHLTLPDGRIDTMASGVPLKPSGWYHADAHDDKWLTNHRAAAQMGDGYCSNCHQPKECVDCHNGVQKPLKFHPNNWPLMHPTAARRNAPDCQSCHRSQTFCVDCHQQAKVAWEGGGQADLQSRDIQFHPDGWVSYSIRGANHHGFQAQRNIRACASCHTEQTCLKCHSTTDLNGYGINPHPPGFAGSRLCRGMFKRNHRVCTKCHTLDSQALLMCR